MGIRDPVRIEWAEHHVTLEDVTIEVKASAYLQAWEQKQLSRITFTGLKGTPYSPRLGYDPAGKQYNAQVYVFGVPTATTHEALDPLNIDQWDWYVLSRSKLRELDQSTISLASVRSLAERVGFLDLKRAIRAAAAITDVDRDKDSGDLCPGQDDH